MLVYLCSVIYFLQFIKVYDNVNIFLAFMINVYEKIVVKYGFNDKNIIHVM